MLLTIVPALVVVPTSIVVPTARAETASHGPPYYLPHVADVGNGMTIVAGSYCLVAVMIHGYSSSLIR